MEGPGKYLSLSLLGGVQDLNIQSRLEVDRRLAPRER